MIHENFNRIFERESSRYVNKPDPTDDIVFMRVSCQTHLNYCINKYWQGRQAPVAEVFYLNDQDKIELSDFDERHRSAAGIQNLFVTHELIPDKYDPVELLARAGPKYLDIV